jgi:tRNA/tmRNA/rRNA uracil-C5-methylase (TrmA/RlmC/RlmD family)
LSSVDGTPTPSLLGQLIEVEVGPVAHGGHCVARLGGEHGRVVFVRHALPGERVRVLITEDGGGGFCRADAVEILTASADRVLAPCRYAGPGKCGGCDFQHVDPAAQRALKAAVVREQLQRLAGIDRDVVVEELPGGPLGWRTRITYAVAPSARPGLRRHRTHLVEVVDECLLGVPGVGDAPELRQKWAGSSGIEIAAGDDGTRSVLKHVPVANRSGRRPARRGHTRERVELVTGPTHLSHRVGGVDFTVSAGGFWQVHPGAAEALTGAVLSAAAARPGQTALDLYAGAGLFSVALADVVGLTGRVVGLEGSSSAAADAAANLSERAWASVQTAAVTAATIDAIGPVDLIVLDPPRSGAGRDVMTSILGAGARKVVYVACDPAALARDLRTALDLGWAIESLRAFDCFPMTHHVECVCALVPPLLDVS